ncbi:MAG: hypothetical protein FWE04_05700 [Oscillospiraceae bacterium]|nr:hypothetical protein [Oscillospiraceae bacterium]
MIKTTTARKALALLLTMAIILATSLTAMASTLGYWEKYDVDDRFGGSSNRENLFGFEIILTSNDFSGVSGELSFNDDGGANMPITFDFMGGGDSVVTDNGDGTATVRYLSETPIYSNALNWTYFDLHIIINSGEFSWTTLTFFGESGESIAEFVVAEFNYFGPADPGFGELIVNGTSYDDYFAAQDAVYILLQTEDVTVEGEWFGVAYPFMLDIPSNRTVTWETTQFSGSPGWHNALIQLTGSGTFIFDGEIDVYNGIGIKGSGDIIINGGLIEVNDGWAAIENSNGTVTMNGGQIATNDLMHKTIDAGDNSSVTMTGGQIINNNWHGVTDGPADISGGVIFSYGNNIYDIFADNPAISGNAIIILWNGKALNWYPAGATVTVNDDMDVITYSYGGNSGTIPVILTPIGQGFGTLIINGDEYSDYMEAQNSMNTLLETEDVTVRGYWEDANESFRIDIPTDRAVFWEAEISGNPGQWAGLIEISGEGTFQLNEFGKIAVFGMDAKGIQGDGDIIINGGSVIASSGCESAIQSWNGSVTIIDGRVEADGLRYYAVVIGSNSSLTMTGGQIINHEDNRVIYGSADISGGVVFSYASSMDDMFGETPNFNTPTGNGIIIWWNGNALNWTPPQAEVNIVGDAIEYSYDGNEGWFYIDFSLSDDFTKGYLIVNGEKFYSLRDAENEIRYLLQDEEDVLVEGEMWCKNVPALDITIPLGRTVEWQANLTTFGDIDVVILRGEGTFHMTGGLISQDYSNADDAIWMASYDVKLIIDGGIVSSIGPYAIWSGVDMEIKSGAVFGIGESEREIFRGGSYTLSGNGIIIWWDGDTLDWTPAQASVNINGNMIEFSYNGNVGSFPVSLFAADVTEILSVAPDFGNDTISIDLSRDLKGEEVLFVTIWSDDVMLEYQMMIQGDDLYNINFSRLQEMNEIRVMWWQNTITMRPLCEVYEVPLL